MCSPVSTAIRRRSVFNTTVLRQPDFSAAGRMTLLVNPDGERTSYAYDSAGRRITQVEADGTRVTNTYDAASQLTGEERSGTSAYTTTFTYDAVGNRLKQRRRQGDILLILCSNGNADDSGERATSSTTASTGSDRHRDGAKGPDENGSASGSRRATASTHADSPRPTASQTRRNLPACGRLRSAHCLGSKHGNNNHLVRLVQF